MEKYIYILGVVILLLIIILLVTRKSIKENFTVKRQRTSTILVPNRQTKDPNDKLLGGCVNEKPWDPYDSCPNGKCPGLGKGFILPGLDVITNSEFLPTGKTIFTDTKLDSCAVSNISNTGKSSFVSANSTEQFISQMKNTSSASGGVPVEVVTLKASASAALGKDIATTEHIKTTHMDKTWITGQSSIIQDIHCMSMKNLSPDLLSRFRKLEEKVNAASEAAWSNYKSFFLAFGTHILTSIDYGSRFQNWQTDISNSDVSLKLLEAKACADVEGPKIPAAGSWSVNSCNNYSDQERKEALKLNTTSTQVIIGGSDETRNNLLNSVNSENLKAFIHSAQCDGIGSTGIQFFFTPIWEILHRVFSYDPNKLKGYDPNIQRCINLEAAFAFIYLPCKQKISNGIVYQDFKENTDSAGYTSYQCWAKKTGCASDTGCQRSNAVCYCAGSTCFEEHPFITGSENDTSAIRSKRQGKYNSGLNKSCSLKANLDCKCNTEWDKDLPDRILWSST